MKRTFDARHHSARPVSAIKPNPNVNQNPNYTPPAPEKAAINNPSLPGPVGMDTTNSRHPMPLGRRQNAADVSDPASPSYDPSSLDYDPALDESSDEYDGDADDRSTGPEIKIS